MVRFVHTADLQLGMTRRFLSPEAQARFAQARIDAIRAIGALALREGAEFVVVSGDVFESSHVDRQVVGRALEALAEIPVPVFLLPGNHDPLGAGSVYSSSVFTAQRPANVTVLDSDDPVVVRPGVEVVGAPWPTKRPVVDLVSAAAAGPSPAPGTKRIVVGHGAVDALFPERRDPALIVLADLEQLIDEGRVHYIALGDRHSTTAVGRTGRIWYAGAPEPTDHDETDPGNALVVTLDGDAVDVARHRVGTWSFAFRELRVDSSEDVDAVATSLDATTDKGRTILRVALVGTLTLRDQARLAIAIDERRPLFASLEVWEPASELTILPDKIDTAELGVTGFASAALVELELRATPGSPERAVAAEALCLAYRLSQAAA